MHEYANSDGAGVPEAGRGREAAPLLEADRLRADCRRDDSGRAARRACAVARAAPRAREPPLWKGEPMSKIRPSPPIAKPPKWQCLHACVGSLLCYVAV